MTGSRIAKQLADTLPRLLKLSHETPKPNDPDAFLSEWWAEEKSLRYFGGVPDFRDRPALVYIVHAMRQLCAVNRNVAIALLEEAIREIKGTAIRPRTMTIESLRETGVVGHPRT
jgi:hypothetical protein